MSHPLLMISGSSVFPKHPSVLPRARAATSTSPVPRLVKVAAFEAHLDLIESAEIQSHLEPPNYKYISCCAEYDPEH